MARKTSVDTFELAASRGAYDEYPIFPPGKDPQLCLSRNDREQPFFLLCEKDTLIAQMSGEGRVDFKGTAVNSFPLEPGDFIYVPAGTPHRLVPSSESVNFRYKPSRPGLEGVAWYCAKCGTELHREIWDTASTSSQAACFDACRRFSADNRMRTCGVCRELHPPIDLSPFNWQAVAAEIEADRSA